MGDLDRYLFVPFFLFAFLIPIFLPASNGFLVLSIIAVLYKIDKERIRFNFKFFLTSTAVLFFAYLMGVFYTENPDRGINFLGRIATFLIIPLVLGFNSKLDYAKVQRTMFYGLTIGLVLACLYLLVNVFIGFMSAGDFSLRSLFSYRYTTQKFVLPLKESHPTYFGLYILVCSIMWEFHNYRKLNKFKAVIYSIFLISLIFLNSRIIFIVAIIYALFFIFYKLKTRKQKAIVLLSGLILVSSVVYLIKDTYFVKKWERGVVWDLSDNVGNSNTTKKFVSDSRMARWKVAVSKYLEKPFFGYGTGMETTVLNKAYLENDMDFSHKKKYNAHNQYLNFLLELGMLGLVIFIYFISINVFRSVKTKNHYQFLFLLFIMCISCTENILVRNMGITFFALFFNISKLAFNNEEKQIIDK